MTSSIISVSSPVQLAQGFETRRACRRRQAPAWRRPRRRSSPEVAGNAAQRRGDGGDQREAIGPGRAGQRHGQEQHVGRHEKDRAFDEGDDGQPDFGRLARRQRQGPVIELASMRSISPVSGLRACAASWSCSAWPWIRGGGLGGLVGLGGDAALRAMRRLAQQFDQLLRARSRGCAPASAVSCAVITSTPSCVSCRPASGRSRIFRSSGRKALATSKRSSAAVETLLTFCPPGPEARMKLQAMSSSSMASGIGDPDHGLDSLLALYG